jgi:hypothetical protein
MLCAVKEAGGEGNITDLVPETSGEPILQVRPAP